MPAIRHAKQKRQVIIVTHNPNIAIACDADQIIYSHMNKEKQGIWIDIFPMDNTSNNLFIAKINYLRILILKKFRR